jgi:signal transduction histidine kinase
VTIGRMAAAALWAGSWMGYAAVFLLLHQTSVNDIAAVLLLVPLIVGSYLFGIRGGVAGAVGMWPVQITLFLSTGHGPGWDMVAGVEGFFGLLALAALGVGSALVFERVRILSNLNVEKDRLVATVSHEVRNPLTGIVGLSSLLADGWDQIPAEEARGMVAMISAEAQSLTEIIDDLLDVSRLRAGVVKLEAIPVELARAATEQVGGRVPVLGGATAVADPLRVGQIVRNLMVNAERYGEEPIEVVIAEHDGLATLEVTDRGPGVDAALADDLFTPFATSGRPGSTGLGLSVSRQLARAMGGDLEYLRDAGVTVFRLTLPALTGAERSDSVSASAPPG